MTTAPNPTGFAAAIGRLSPAAARVVGHLKPHELFLAAAQQGQIQAVDLLDTLVVRKNPEWKKDWAASRALIAAATGSPMSPSEFATYQQCTGRAQAPEAPPKEIWEIVGRRGGKSRVAALLGAYLALCRDYSAYLAPGERGFVVIMSRSQKEARQVTNYIRGMLSGPLAPLIGRALEDSIELAAVPITIEVIAANWRGGGRSRTVVGAVCDEIAFWRSDDGTSSNPDTEILRTLRPSMSTIPDALLFGLSSPYARRGVLWDMHQRYWGPDKELRANAARVLVWRAPTWVMHPPSKALEEEIERAFAEDPTAAAAEYGAEFRTDVEALVTLEVVLAATADGRVEIPPDVAVNTYYGFVDPSGGTVDSYTLAIAHYDKSIEKVVLDLSREWKSPYSPEKATEEAAVLLKAYGVRQVYGDKYAGMWPTERFRANGITYTRSERTRSDIYKDFLAPLNAQRVELLDIPAIRAQLLNLDRRTSRGGMEIIDHRPGTHDDVANSVAGVTVIADSFGSRRQGKTLPVPEPQSTREILNRRLSELANRAMKRAQSMQPREQQRGGYSQPVNAYQWRRR